jgi:flagellar motor protein MotB
MAKKAKCPEPEECPEWIFTFADLVMLMMGFFVILWVLKPPENKKEASGEEQRKWLETVAEIRKPFGWVPDPLSADPVDKQALKKPDAPAGKGGQVPDPPDGARGAEPLVTNVRPGTHVAIGGRLAFAPGDAALSGETQRVADEVFERIRGHRNIFQVKGHAAPDDFPDGAGPQKFMDLSLRRAQAVADYLVGKGVSPDVVRVQGCSTFEPIVQRAYGEGAQAMNRRVEVEVTNVSVPERQDRAAAKSVPPVGSGPVAPNAPAAAKATAE